MANSASVRRYLRDFKKNPAPYDLGCLAEKSARQAKVEVQKQMRIDLDNPRQQTLASVQTFRTGPNSARVYITDAGNSRGRVSPARYLEPLIRGGTIQANRGRHRPIVIAVGKFRRANGNPKTEVFRALKAISNGTKRGPMKASALTSGHYYLRRDESRGSSIYRRRKGSSDLELMARLPRRATYRRNTLNWDAAIGRVRSRQLTFIRQCRRRARLYR